MLGVILGENLEFRVLQFNAVIFIKFYFYTNNFNAVFSSSVDTRGIPLCVIMYLLHLFFTQNV